MAKFNHFGLDRGTVPRASDSFTNMNALFQIFTNNLMGLWSGAGLVVDDLIGLYGE